MPLLLNIDTATDVASVCITLNGTSLALLTNKHQKEHASFVHTAIAEILKNTGFTLKDIAAFAVTAGPGSYTGLRVGLAAAKGFCYALSKPLITINTLEVMTRAATDITDLAVKEMLMCPMMDARRMEVYTAVYTEDAEIVRLPKAVILEEALFDDLLKDNNILFFGSGSLKFKQIKTHHNMIFENIQHDASHLGILAEKAFQQQKLENVSYALPVYLKDFYSIK